MTFELAVPLERARRDGRADRVAFARLCNVDPDPWQQEVLRSEAHRMHLNCARQTGKSTVCSLLALHRAIYWPNQTVLLISPSLRQSSELQRKVTDRLQLLALRPELDGDSKTVIELANRSRIISLPATESTVRSFTANLIVEDESGDVDDDLHTAILPMLIVSRGRLILAGTPKGQRGHFYEIAKERSAHWEYHRVTVSQNARADVLELEEQRLRLRHLYRQEYECEFIVGGEGMVYGAFSAAEHVIDELPRLEPGEVWRYSLGIDFGFRDATAFVVLAHRPNDPTAYVVFSEKQARLTPSQVGDRVASFESVWRFARIVGDTGGLGKAYSEELKKRFHLPVEDAEKNNKRGYIELMNGDFANGRIKILRGTNVAYLKELVELPWDEDREKENASYENHLCDAGLYIWRASMHYLAKPKPAPLAPEEKLRREVDEFGQRDERERRMAREEQAMPQDAWLFEGTV